MSVEPLHLGRERIVADVARALVAHGATPANAAPVAEATAAAEFAGKPSHGLLYVPIYCEHLAVGKVDGRAEPRVDQPRPALLTVDAGAGFAHPAIAAGFERLVPLARTMGVAAMAVRNSYNCGLLGFHTDRLAEAGLLGLGFTNAPASIAPAGGRTPALGTNPVAIAVPGPDGQIALSLDQSASVVAKSEVMKAAREGRPIPEGWALDPDGRSTTDAAIGLKGSMAPLGGSKGVGLALLVELLAAAATGATLGVDASPFSGPAGGPPRTGQFFIAIDPGASSGGAFADRVARLCDVLTAQPGTRLPGSRRRASREAAEARGTVAVDAALHARVLELGRAAG